MNKASALGTDSPAASAGAGTGTGPSEDGMTAKSEDGMTVKSEDGMTAKDRIKARLALKKQQSSLAGSGQEQTQG